MLTPRRPALVLLLVVLLLAAACGDDGSSGGASGDGDGGATTTSAPGDSSEVAFVNPYTDHVSEVYGDDGVWLCRPDLTDDVCDEDLTTTEVAPDGSLSEVAFEPATDPGLDCFYVYPTLDYSAEPGTHPFEEDNPLVPVTVQGQAARFGSVCDLYVPLYRQATIGSYDAVGEGEDLFDTEPFADAYADVADAFKHYMATWNDDRPFVLLGHSQGSHHLIRLLQEEFDDDPALQRGLVSALVVGPTGRLRVPEGEVVGGTFDTIPLCAAADETGCAVGFDSFAEAEPPTRGGVDDEGNVGACVNPSQLSDGDDRLDASYFGRTVPGVTTFTEVVRDHYTGACTETDDGVAYLEIAEAPLAGDTRELTHIDSAVESSESLHVLDYNFTLGDLLDLVQQQSAAHAAD